MDVHGASDHARRRTGYDRPVIQPPVTAFEEIGHCVVRWTVIVSLIATAIIFALTR
jgi:hypothetical protein